jgi:ubiquinone/menaquinone biosynthesis C-methylase UbiE
VRRVLVPELLDSDAGTESEVQTALADLRRINRWFGGTSTTLAMLERVIERTNGQKLSLLEVASGAADAPRAALERARKRGVFLRTTYLDRRLSHLRNVTPAVVGDALQLPFASESFDLVSCGLFTHHLDAPEIVRFAQEGLRVARVAMLINDLERSSVHWAMAWMGRPLWRSRLTRHDSVVAVRRSYTTEELRSLLRQAQPAKVEISRYYFFRFGAIAWKKGS